MATTFVEFYWGVLRIVHEGCPFVEIAKRLNIVIHPQVIEMPYTEGAVPFYAVLDSYFTLDEMTNALTPPIPNLDVHSVAPDIEQERTLIFGSSLDEVLQQATKDPRFRRIPVLVYARPDFEFLPIRSVTREGLDDLEKQFKSVVGKGEVSLDTVGKVRSYRDLVFWRETISPISVVPGLTPTETRILEAATAYGYYKTPRRLLTLDELAEKLGMSKTRLGNILREIENKIVNDALYKKFTRKT